MAIASYEGLLRQQQEVLMLRHDMTRHLRALQGMVTEPQAAAYLHALTGGGGGDPHHGEHRKPDDRPPAQ